MLRRGLLQEYATVFSIGVRVIDICCIVIGGFAAYGCLFNSFSLPIKYQTALILGGLISSMVFSWFHIYDSWRGRNLLTQIRTLALAWLTVLSCLMVIATLMKTSAYYSRLWLGLWCIASLLLLMGYRLGVMLVL